MDQSTKVRLEMATNCLIDKTPWESDVISLMVDQLIKYTDIAGGKLPEKYLRPVKRCLSLCDLLKEDLEFFSEHIPAVEKLHNNIELFQFHGNTPQASVLLSAQEDGMTYIGVSTAFIKFIHLYFSKFLTLTQTYREENLHDDYLEEIRKEKWDCLPIYLSILKDAALYHRVNYELEISKYRFLYQPYNYCDLVIAARQFGLLHEVAHLYIKRNLKQDAINDHGEEYLSDIIAYQWLMEPFMQKNKLSETDRYDLSVRVQAPLYYFVAGYFPFSIHHWDADKTAVLRKRERDFYRIHPLRREMSLMSGMVHQPVFRKYPEMVNYLYAYISNEHIAYDPDTFFCHKYGPAGILAFTDNSEDLYTIMQCLYMSRADAYHAYSEKDYMTAFKHGEALAWLQQKLIRYNSKENNWDEGQMEEAWLEVDQIIKRRMGLMEDYGALRKVSIDHEELFGEVPMKCYDISKRGWKKRYGVMQVDVMVIAEAQKSEIIDISSKQDKYEVSTSEFQEIRNLDGDLPMLIFNFSADFMVGTSAGVFATFLYDFLKSIRAKRIRLGEEEIDLIKETVEQAVINAITRSVENMVSTDEEDTKD